MIVLDPDAPAVPAGTDLLLPDLGIRRSSALSMVAGSEEPSPTPTPAEGAFWDLDESYAEGQRIAHPGQRAAQSFHRHQLSLAKRLFADMPEKSIGLFSDFLVHDFDKEPVRFFHSCHQYPNAWFSPWFEIPTFAFTSGLTHHYDFLPEPIIARPSENALIVIHEVLHYKIDQYYGPELANSKFEEAIVTGVPVYLAYLAGFDPRVAPGLERKFALFLEHAEKDESLKQLSELSRMLDPHPTHRHLQLTVEFGLTAVHKAKGEVLRDTAFPNQEYRPGGKFLSAVAEIRHESYLDREIAQIDGYKNLSSGDKLRCLSTILLDMEDRTEIRLHDLEEEIGALRNTLTSEDDFLALHESADACISLMDEGFADIGRHFYHLIGSLDYSLGKNAVLGRFRKIDASRKAFIDATKNAPLNVVESRAEDMMLAVSEESLVSDARMGTFFESLSWSHYEIPDIERFLPEIEFTEEELPSDLEGEVPELVSLLTEEATEDGPNFEPLGDHFDDQQGEDEYAGDEKSELAYLLDEEEVAEERELPRVEWHRLRKLAFESEIVAEAAWSLHMELDAKIMQAMLSHPKLAESYFFGGDRPQLVGSHPHRDKVYIFNLEMDGEGYVSGIDHSGIDEEYVLYFAAQEIAHDLFRNSEATPETVKKLRFLSNLISPDETSDLPFYEIMGENLPLFLLLHSSAIAGYQSSVASRLVQLLEIDPERYRGPVRSIFRPPEQKENEDDTPDSSLEVMDGEKLPELIRRLKSPKKHELSIYEQCLKSGRGSRDAHPVYGNLFTGILLDPQLKLFDEHETSSILCAAVTRGLRKGYLELENSAERKRDLGFYRSHMERLGEYFPYEKRSWGVLIREFERSQIEDDDPIGMLRIDLLRAELVDLAEHLSPSAARILKLLEVCDDREIFLPDSFEQSARDLLAPRFERFLEERSIGEKIPFIRFMASKGIISPAQEDDAIRCVAEEVADLTHSPQKIALCESLLAYPVYDPPLRAAVVSDWSQAVKHVYGDPDLQYEDHGDPQYQEQLRTVLHRLSENLDRALCLEMFRELAADVSAQRPVLRDMKTSLLSLSDEQQGSVPLVGIGVEGLLTILEKNEKLRVACEQFFTTPCTDQSIENFSDVLSEHKVIVHQLTELLGGLFKGVYTKEGRFYRLRQLHRNYASAPHAVRTAFGMAVFFDRSSDDEELTREDIAATFDRVLGKDAQDPFEREVSEIYIDELEPYQRRFYVSAALVAAPPKEQGEKLRPGQRIAACAESLSAYEIKGCQFTVTNPAADKQIRDDLEYLTHDADPPYLWDVDDWYALVEDEVNENFRELFEREGVHGFEDRDPVTRTGVVEGSGSLYAGRSLFTGDGRRWLIAHLKPDSLARAQDGANATRRAIPRLSSHNELFQGLAERAEARLVIEADPTIADRQYARAGLRYDNTTIEVDDYVFPVELPQVPFTGKSYYVMEFMPGRHYGSVIKDESLPLEYRQALAMACLTLELGNIFNGIFDSDRKGGNILMEDNIIHPIDMKGLLLEDFNDEGYRQFASLLVSSIRSSDSLEKLMASLVDNMEPLQSAPNGIDDYVSEAVTALLSLGQNYEILEPHHFQRVVLSALSGGVHPAFEEALIDEVCQLDTLSRWPVNKIAKWQVHQLTSKGKLPWLLKQSLPYSISRKDLIRVKRNRG